MDKLPNRAPLFQLVDKRNPTPFFPVPGIFSFVIQTGRAGGEEEKSSDGEQPFLPSLPWLGKPFKFIDWGGHQIWVTFSQPDQPPLTQLLMTGVRRKGGGEAANLCVAPTFPISISWHNNALFYGLLLQEQIAQLD